MKKTIFFIILGAITSHAQTTKAALEAAVNRLLNEPAATAASLSFYVSDENGNPIYAYHSEKGLSTASTQKIFTAAAALETLGSHYQWTTSVAYIGNLCSGVLKGDLILTSDGDPTLGSWRYQGYEAENFKQKLTKALKETGLNKIEGRLIIDDTFFDFQTIPGGWPWNDLGNYYGAGVWGVNWRENQFDLSTNGSSLEKTSPELPNVKWVSEVAVGGNSDQSIIYTAPHSDFALINGTLPEKKMTVSGAMPNPPLTLGQEIMEELRSQSIEITGGVTTASQLKISGEPLKTPATAKTFFTHNSPPLEQVVYWFLSKSVNLYGETLIKTMAKKKLDRSDFKTGIGVLKQFWTTKGLDPYQVNFADGSGLSPQNYVSAKAEVQALLYIRKQPWFETFYQGLPTLNGMKMKSGTMKNTKSFAGYHTSKSGQKYVYAILLNNYQSPKLSEALYNVLNVLK
ncbi:D-alanyl-D-alanine carboxypeptidase/D-alanyl-D-alanine endopeptidase [Bergeyella sp. RCAD1439]|uniref:D-alanyl-D-alanine carboxypeptidase/D-alanyl-D-alanine endopeptidase n=1 Tax=Bergeyella anatis TaxID=3113737 RepID=UPI002E173D36|nr:D-alanyl-D-alanine carboxypeptidase/D-alanyl-D-alanine-endopeptidase [Bergeyella sp. RCAD1439]